MCMWRLHQRYQNQAQADGHCYQGKWQKHLKGTNFKTIRYENSHKIPEYLYKRKNKIEANITNGSVLASVHFKCAPFLGGRHCLFPV